MVYWVIFIILVQEKIIITKDENEKKFVITVHLVYVQRVVFTIIRYFRL
jgi:hypothetical protein